MFSKLTKIFIPTEPGADEPEGIDAVPAAVAVLLVEIAKADHDHSDIEAGEIQNQLARQFSLGEEEAGALAEQARATARQSVSLHDFTKTLHERMSYEQKMSVIEMLWRIALADRNLDKYEDYMIGKIAELLYVYRADVLRIKHRVTDAL
jgi:uncharacterized tellurite resistance protein B-like protein